VPCNYPIAPKRAPPDPTLTAAGYEEAIFADATTTCVWRALAGLTPAQRAGAPRPAPAALDRYGWQQHCRGLFELPIAA